MAVKPTDHNRQAYLPDFCSASTLFVVLLIAELVAIVLTLAAQDADSDFLLDLSKMSLFLLWLAILSSSVMCLLREKLESLGPTRAFVSSFILLVVLCVVLAALAYNVTVEFGSGVIIDEPQSSFLLRTLAISSIVLALSMRYLYVASEWRRSIVLEAQSRISALQALIRPHFLFNSMNTIASLTRTDPSRAEEAVEDLSDLLRANLGAARDRTSLKQEFEIAAIYQRIEKLRLGERLHVRWELGELPMRAMIPSLTIQPLLENAIYHGIEQLPEGGEVLVSGREDDKMLEIVISNPVAPGRPGKDSGNKMALSNIRQRYEIAYEGRATVSVDATDDKYTVTLRFPMEVE
ncbi:MAG: histidine kinase [Pseudomonadota bacterium]